MDKIRIGVIGTGRIGRFHAENLAGAVKGAELVAVADVDSKSAEQCAVELGIDSYEDHRKLLDRKDIDAVVICSSTDTHSSMIIDAANTGKQIFCEKPIDFDLGRIDNALEAVRKAGVKLQIGFNRRFDPSFSRVRELVQNGSLGKLNIVRITSRDPSPPPISYIKVSGGLFLDMTIHDFDMARFLAGSEIKDIYAIGAVLVDPEIGKAGDIDSALISFTYENGALGSIDNSRKAVFGYDQRIEVFGSKGMAEAQNDYPNNTIVSDADSIHRDLPHHFFMERYAQSYIGEMREFVSAIVEDTDPPVTGADGRAPVVIGKAAMRSMQEKRTVLISEFA